jgi:hypothetical protein
MAVNYLNSCRHLWSVSLYSSRTRHVRSNNRKGDKVMAEKDDDFCKVLCELGIIITIVGAIYGCKCIK